MNHIGMYRPNKVCMVFGPFPSQNGYSFAHFGLESDLVFDETKGV